MFIVMHQNAKKIPCMCKLNKLNKNDSDCDSEQF